MSDRTRSVETVQPSPAQRSDVRANVQMAPSAALDNQTVMRLSRAGVRAMGGGADDPTSNQTLQAAARGTSGTGSRLPYFDAIQRSFGRHDVSAIEAHVGPEAAKGAAQMGAQAFATGNHVAFRDTPSLHTAAHEAAHVVQQRGGVQLSGGVGKAGDHYEQHADRVADLVVRGQSSEAALDEHAGTGRVENTGVQRQCATCAPDEPCSCATGAVVQKKDGPYMVPEPPTDEKAGSPQNVFELDLPGPGGKKWRFSSDRLVTYDLLAEMWKKHGKAAVQDFAASCDAHEPDAQKANLSSPMSQAWTSDNNTPPPAKSMWSDKPPPLPAQTQPGYLDRDRVYRAIKAMAGNLVANHTSTISSFQATAADRLRTMLQLSRTQVIAERDRYGLDAKNKPTDKSKSADVQKDLAEMAPHARRLAQLKRRLDAEKAHDVDVRVNVPLFAFGLGAPPKVPIWDDTMRAAKEYDDERAFAFSKWPVLAGFDNNADKWDEVGSGATAAKGGPKALDLIGSQIEAKLDSIQHLEENIGDGAMIWTLPLIVSGTKGVQKIDHGSIYDFWIDEHVKQVEANKKFVEDALAVITLSLVLITLIPTGGSSALALVGAGAAIGGAALSTYQAVEAVKEYRLEHAKANSSFDRAMLLRREEPSMWPAALAVAGAILDAKQALDAFRSLVALRRAAMVGEVGAKQQLIARGDEIRPRLGTELASDIGKPAAAPRSLAESQRLGDVIPAMGGHSGFFNKSGKLTTCSPYCAEAWWRFESLLESRPDLKARLINLEAGVIDETIALSRKGQAKAFLEELRQIQEIKNMTNTQLYAAVENLGGTSIGRELKREAMGRFGTLELGTLGGKAAEYPALAARDASARLLPENFRAFDGVNALNPKDATFGYRVTTEVINGQTVTVINQHIRGGKWYSIKTLQEVATERRVVNNVDTALKKAWNDAQNKIAYTPAMDPIAAPDGTRWRVWKDGPASEIEIVVQIPIKNAADEAAEIAKAQAWADKALKNSTMPSGLPKTTVVVQAAPIGPK